MCAAMLRMSGIEKRFGEVIALNNVTFELEHGEIHALLGANGAGKSTLVKMLAGLCTRDAGTIELRGRNVEFADPGEAIRRGIATVHQHPQLVPNLTGFENIYLGREFGRSTLFSRFHPASLRKRANELLRRFPIEINLDCPVRQLSFVDREVVAVLHALANDNVSILVLDEPTSVLTEREKPLLFRLMRTLKAVGISIIYITHQLADIFNIADRVTILRDGRNVGTHRLSDVESGNLSIADLVLGERSEPLYPAKNCSAGDVYLEVRCWTKLGAFQEINLAAHRGEVLGIFGLVGSGIDELAKTLFGVTRPTSGTLNLLGMTTTLSGPHDALRRGVFLLPGDRQAEGLTLTRDVTFNVTLANLKRACGTCGYLRLSEMKQSSQMLAERVTLQPPLLDREVRTFSGGNQQKILVAKGLYVQALIYIFVEPTVGIDIGARSKIYGLMRELAKSAAVIVMSSDCDEVCGIADRVIAMYRGRMVHEGAASGRGELLMAGITGSPQSSPTNPLAQ
ncbi:sugar ABC transporter ATP-binding protein [Bradyrhizobium sp. MOS001]|uniref:sugar ABC transporter ATP-binding protein n=1 Tax=Bradyrhizobium sp. MOS001 TaxID=2133948 RepID=UPI0010757BC8|nr:sugar ABC transporter ATP-binding protein [Bradyrhizobium sp. MOS001]TFW53523.1 sugar ABC transporter ATP-binding protein [Bradyrhizobium sp. MOS001]